MIFRIITVYYIQERIEKEVAETRITNEDLKTSFLLQRFFYKLKKDTKLTTGY